VEQHPYKPKFSELSDMSQILMQERKKEICREVERLKQSHLVHTHKNKTMGIYTPQQIHDLQAKSHSRLQSDGLSRSRIDQGHTTITSPRRSSNVSRKLLIKSA
jgi:hypothetical protein